jgi:hypothetical protein
MSRATVRLSMPQPKAVSSEIAPNTPIEASKVRLRPMESARRPPRRAPKNSPSVLALKKVPS